MGHWGVRSHENDDASDALDAGFDRVHGAAYDALMDDRNPLPFDQVQKQLANAATLAAAIEALGESVGRPFEDWDDIERLAFAGVVVRHAELGVAIPDDLRLRAIDWLENEELEWPEATLRRLRRDKELALLRGQK
jgi:hypothetical protein